MTEDDVDLAESDLAQIVERLQKELGPKASWPEPVRLESLAQCVMNSIYSTGNRSESVIRVLDRYRKRRRDAGHDPTLDGPAELLGEIRECGGPEGFAESLDNRWRAWSRMEAPLKTQVIHQAAELLLRHSVNTRGELAATLKKEATRDDLKRGWLALPGQRSGLTWRYFLMNAGMPGIKADRMITRWTTRTLGRPTTPVEAERLLHNAAQRLGVEDRRLDHALWAHERQRSGRRTTA